MELGGGENRSEDNSKVRCYQIFFVIYLKEFFFLLFQFSEFFWGFCKIQVFFIFFYCFKLNVRRFSFSKVKLWGFLVENDGFKFGFVIVLSYIGMLYEIGYKVRVRVFRVVVSY